MRSALSLNQFELHYQPELSLRTRHAVGCEALIHWRHPTNGVIDAGRLSPLSPSARGRSSTSGAGCSARLARTPMRWSNDIRVTVNVSALQLQSTEFVHDVKAALAHAKLDPAKLQLEIGEQLFDRHSSGTLEKLHQLRKFGIGIALDDFGKGSGSLGNLRGLSLRRGQDRAEADQGRTQPRGQRGDRSVGRHARAGLVDAQRR